MQWRARPAEFRDQFLAASAHFFEVGRTKRAVGGPGENQIANFQIAHRPIVGGGSGIDLFRDPKRGFADFVVRSDVAHDRRVKLVAVDHNGVVPNFPPLFSEKDSRNNDVGIGRANEKAEVLEGIDFPFHPLDPGPKITVSFHGQAFLQELAFVLAQLLFCRGKKWIRVFGFLFPAIAGERLEIGRRTIDLRQPIGVGTVRIHVHLGLEQKRVAFGVGIAQAENGLAIVEVVPGKELIESDQALAQTLNLHFVKLLKKRRDRVGADCFLEVREKFWQLGRHFRQLVERSVGGWNTYLEFQIKDITLRVGPFGG